MSKFESNLIGRTINAIAPGIYHQRNDLPAPEANYKVHTMWSDEGLPMMMAEIIRDEDEHDLSWAQPDQVKVYVVQLGMLWNLQPEEKDDED